MGVRRRRRHRGGLLRCTLTTDGLATGVGLSAWSTEGLAEAASTVEEQADLKWSYADSPMCLYGLHHFDSVNAAFQARPQPHDLSDDDADAEIDLRLQAMESAMSRLDAEGLFGTGGKRAAVVLAVEFMPPDHTNTERVLRLNPPEAVTAWLDEAAVPE